MEKDKEFEKWVDEHMPNYHKWEAMMKKSDVPICPVCLKPMKPYKGKPKKGYPHWWDNNWRCECMPKNMVLVVG